MDINKMNVDDKGLIAKDTADAIGRREDQLIIDALEATVGTATTVGDGSADMSVELLRTVKYTLDNNNVPEEDRTIVHSSKALEDLLGATVVTSSDFNVVKTLVNGEVNTFLGFKFKMIGSRSEGGLPIPSADERYNFAYHKQAVGLAIGKEMTAMVDWVAQKTAWQIGCVFSAGAVAIDTNGIVVIHTKED
jgi:hypothetical protein